MPYIELIERKKRGTFFSMSALLNQHLGKKLRLRRNSLGLTQTQVAQAINVTFQQIQKYEKGTNGVSSARLLQLSTFLNVPVNFFFEDYSDGVEKSSETAHSLNFSFIVKTFNDLESSENSKLLEILNNQSLLKKVI